MSRYDDHVANMPASLHALILAIADNEGLDGVRREAGRNLVEGVIRSEWTTES